MKQIVVRILSSGYEYPISDFEFFDNGKQAVFCPQDDDYDETNTDNLYNYGQFEIIERDIVVHKMTHQEYVALIDKKNAFDASFYKSFVYDGEFNAPFKNVSIKGFYPFIEKYNEVNSLKEEIDIDYLFDSEAFKFFCKVREKYRAQAKTYSCVNEFELEPYGFKTDDLIQTCLQEHDYMVKRNAAYEKEYKEVFGV